MLRTALIVVLAGLCLLCRQFEERTTALSQTVAGRVETLPFQLGDWTGEQLELDPTQFRYAQLTGSLNRIYRQQGTGRVISILFVWARPDPLSYHTPDQCYTAIGYEMREKPARVPITVEGISKPAEFFMADFVKRQASIDDHLQICWTWTAHGDYVAPDDIARDLGRTSTYFTYGAATLFKLYVIEHRSQNSNPADKTVSSEDFIRLLLPELQKRLFPE